MKHNIKDWFLKLKYGKLKTPYHHFVVLVDGVAEKDITDFPTTVCMNGNAWMSVKVWANDADEAAEIACAIASNIGFQIRHSNNAIQVFSTKPELPPEEDPFAYDINFNPYKE